MRRTSYITPHPALDRVATCVSSSSLAYAQLTHAMAVLSRGSCETYEDTKKVGDVYDDTKPRWKNSLRTQNERQSVERDGNGKPIWKPAPKANSPSSKTYAEGGSLRTQRKRFLNKKIHWL